MAAGVAVPLATLFWATVGMLLNFAVTLVLTPLFPPPSEAVRRMVDSIREPEGVGPAVARGHGLWRVIFDPQLQPLLFDTEIGRLLKKNNITFSKKRSWVRHDDHYHVDFIVPCEEGP